jgi:methionyl-tRNA synthetase
MRKKILITSALPYANGPIHFGHIAGAYLPADAYARFERLKGNDVLYICGSDEYGVAITISAEINNRTPQEHVDIYHNLNKELFDKLNISFDHYSRTTNSYHTKVVQEFFLDLYNNGFIEKRTEEHLFSKEENKFLADRYVVGTCPKCKFDSARGDECQKCSFSYEAKDLINPRSKLTNSKLILKPSTHWYLRFDKFKDKLNNWIKTKNFKENVLNFSKEYIDNLKPRAITRDSAWGVPVPLEEAKNKVLYVWFDAPIGYISATMDWAKKIKDIDKWKDYWLDPDCKLVNFIGKDNIPFHSVFFPAMIMGQNQKYKLVDDIPANEFLMLEKRQFSKSDNWYIDLEDFFKKFSIDQIRYYLASIAPENHDSDFLFQDFLLKCNSELVNKLGNFVNRVLVFTYNNLDKKIVDSKNLSQIDENFLKDINDLIEKADDAYSNYKLRKASQLIMELSGLGNIYFDTKKPWALKKENKTDDLNTTINLCLKCIKALSLISYPIIPTSANEIYKLLGYKTDLNKQNFDDLKKLKLNVGQDIPEPKLIFKKVDEKMIEDEENKLKKTKIEENLPNKSFTPLKKEITYPDFDKMDFRVGVIEQAHKIEKSNKLLKLMVDIGFEKRQIVSGIAKSINPEDLIGKKVIVLANIKPTKLMGIESFGMIIAAGDDENNLEIPFIKNIDKGSIVS